MPVPVLVAPVPALAPEAAGSLLVTGNKAQQTASILPVDEPSGWSHSQSPALPPPELLELQAGWLAPARSRLLRRIAIAGKRRILDLGAGYGHVSVELSRRSSGTVTAFDISLQSLREMGQRQTLSRVSGHGASLPFHHQSFDLVFCQCALLWMQPLEKVLSEIRRVLEPAGVLIIIEPDYGAMVEYPPEISTQAIWLEALNRAGAEPQVGRKLPALLDSLGFSIKVNQLEQIHPPALERFEFLSGLPLSPGERSQLQMIQALAGSADYAGWQQISHLPFFLITAVKP